MNLSLRLKYPTSPIKNSKVPFASPSLMPKQSVDDQLGNLNTDLTFDIPTNKAKLFVEDKEYEKPRPNYL